MVDEIEEVILALRAAGWAVPSYTILDTGVLYFDNRQQEEVNPAIYPEKSGGDVS
jgi:hypothetical protein